VEVTNDQLLQLLKTREKSKNLVYWRIALCQNKNTNIIHHDRWNPDQKFNKFLEYCLSTSFEIDENNQNREKIIKSEVAQWLWQGINQNQISSDIWLYLASIIKCLSEDGKAAFIIPCALLEEPRYYREREFFVSQGCIDAVILLPKRVFSSGSGDYGLLMLSAPQPDKKKNIIFYDARRLGKDRELPHEEMEQIANELRNEKNAVSFEEVMQDNCVLYRENITYDDFIFEDIAKDITRGALFSTKELEFNAQASESNYQVLRLQDIQEGIIEKPLQPLAYIEDRHERYMLDSEIRLLICKNSVDSRFKTAIYNPEEWQEHKKILVTSNIYIIKLSQKVNPYYIQAYLESDEGQKQIADLIGKERFSSLGVSDLKLISVPYCEKQQQDQIAEEFKKIQKETAQCRKQLTDLSQKRKTFFSQKYHK
jgi:type I restriction enzyme M protein